MISLGSSRPCTHALSHTRIARCLCTLARLLPFSARMLQMAGCPLHAFPLYIYPPRAHTSSIARFSVESSLWLIHRLYLCTPSPIPLPVPFGTVESMARKFIDFLCTQRAQPRNLIDFPLYIYPFEDRGCREIRFPLRLPTFTAIRRLLCITTT